MRLCCLLLAIPAFAAPHSTITIDRIARIKYPTDPIWSPDSKAIAFLWDAAGKQDLFLSQEGTTPIALTSFPVNPNTLQSDIGHVEWTSPNSLIFAKDDALWRVETTKPVPVPLPGFDGVAVFTLSRDLQQMAFVRRGQIWVANVKAKTERQVTRFTDNPRLNNLSFSPDGLYLAFSLSHGDDLAEPLPYNGTRVRVFRNVAWDNRLGIVPTLLGDPVLVPTSGGGGVRPAAQWVAGPALLHQELSADRKTREIQITSVTGATRTIWQDHDDAYWTPTAGNGALIAASPNGTSIAFISDKDTHWPHLYVIPATAKSEKEARPLTSGALTAAFPAWSPDGKRIAIAHSVPNNGMERFIDIVDAGTGTATPIVTARGLNLDPVFSPDGSKLLYQRTAPEHPLEIYWVEAHAGGSPHRLTNSLPSEIKVSDLTAPVPVHYPSRAADKKPVPATLIAAANLDKTKKHPAIVWIHSDGPNQNYLGWHPGSWRMYYAMHQYLAQQGYVILTPDYRGSSGYGRDWSTGDYRDIGGWQTKDIAAGADYLKTLPYVDPDRIGVWGLSYGGYLVLQAVVTTPDLFRCAIDVAGVVDWSMGSPPGYTTPRMGSPMSQPAVFDQARVIDHMDELRIPLMILHGTNDLNVPFYESLNLVDRLGKLGKSFDIAIYPGEIHYFRREWVLKDAWRRAEDFFDRHLRVE
jgi:dipeptidyl aminopeptidase/acylaminoacyl peptidase